MKAWQIGLVVLLVLFGYAVMMVPDTTAPAPSPSVVTKSDPAMKLDFMSGCDTEPGYTEFCSCGYDYLVATMSIDEIQSLVNYSEAELEILMTPAATACQYKLY